MKALHLGHFFFQGHSQTAATVHRRETPMTVHLIEVQRDQLPVVGTETKVQSPLWRQRGH